MILMLRASYLSCELIEMAVRKTDDTFVYFKGDTDRINTGYARYFKHDEHEEAKEWIVQKHNRLTGVTPITKETVSEIKNEDISDKERASGKLRRTEKRRVRRSVRSRPSRRG